MWNSFRLRAKMARRYSLGYSHESRWSSCSYQRVCRSETQLHSRTSVLWCLSCPDWGATVGDLGVPRPEHSKVPWDCSGYRGYQPDSCVGCVQGQTTYFVKPLTVMNMITRCTSRSGTYCAKIPISHMFVPFALRKVGTWVDGSDMNARNGEVHAPDCASTMKGESR